jgi:hypothetical protein
MADPAYRPITPRTLGRNAYVPENDPEFMRRQQEPSSYDLFKQSVIQNVYNEALRATGSEERAREAASSASRKMFRTELVGSALVPEAAMAGAGRAVNIAKGLFGRGQAAESASPLLLAPPRRNAMMPDEMLAADAPSVLRMAPDRPPSLANSQSLPRLEYDIPTIRSTGMPPARDVVSSPFDDIGRLAGEGGVTDDAVMAGRRIAQERLEAEEAFRARQLAGMEGEGGTYAGNVAAQRGVEQGQRASQLSREMGIFEGEGGVTADAIREAKNMYARRQAAEQAVQQARIDSMIGEGGGGAISRTPPPGTGFRLGESSSSGVYRPDFTMPGGSQFGLPAVRGGTDVAAMGGPASATGAAPAAGGYDVGAILRMLGGAGMGGGAASVALNTARDLRGEGQAGAAVPNNPPLPLAGTGIAEQMFDRPGLPDDALGGFSAPSDYGSDIMPNRPGLPDDTLGGTSMPATFRRPSAPQSAAANAAPASELESVRLFNKYLEDSMQGDGGGRADLFFRADRERMKEQGLARGGPANGSGKSSSSGKDAAMHKALEIIHHMMVNRQ